MAHEAPLVLLVLRGQQVSQDLRDRKGPQVLATATLAPQDPRALLGLQGLLARRGQLDLRGLPVRQVQTEPTARLARRGQQALRVRQALKAHKG